LSALICLALLVAGGEVAQWALLRTRFWGREAARPFYALGYRAAIGGIISLAIVAEYLANPTITVDGTTLVVLESVAIVVLEVAAGFLSLPPITPDNRTGGSWVAGALFSVVGFFLLGIGSAGGETTAYVGALVALLGGVLVYRRLRPQLGSVPAPAAGPKPPAPEAPLAYGRTGSSSARTEGRPPGGND
ncbi:MAG TPA: hypothetical protein VMH38_00820, partial [Thermoplasmata archaeon]|nr:hypothetical protein [Thermoplasmata archaeon]